MSSTASEAFIPITLDIIRNYVTCGLNPVTTLSRDNPVGENVYLQDITRLLEFAKTWDLSMANEKVLYMCVGESLLLITQRYQESFLGGSISPECDQYLAEWMKVSS